MKAWKHMILNIKNRFYFIVSIILFSQFVHAQKTIKNFNDNYILKDGIYIFFNSKNCYPCFISLKKYFEKIKETKKILNALLFF